MTIETTHPSLVQFNIRSELHFFSEKVTHGLSLSCSQLETGDSRDMSDILEVEAILKKVRLNKNHHKVL